MKVLFLGTVLDRSEAALLRALIERGIEIAGVFEPERPRLELFSEFGRPLRFVSHKSGRRGEDVATVREVINEYQPDVFHVLRSKSLRLLRSTTPPESWPPTLFYRGTIEVPQWWNPAHRQKYLSGDVDRFVAVSEAVRGALIRGGVEAHRITVVRKGHEEAWYRREPAPIRAKLGIAEETFVVGVVANIRWEKGVEFAVAAAEILRRSRDNVRFLIVGDDERPWYQRRFRDLNRPGFVTLLGRHDDVPALMPSFDALLVPSLREGSPRVVVEAIYADVPVIGSRVGGVPEIVLDGKTGLLVEPRDAAGIAAAVRTLMGNRATRERFVATARRHATEMLTVDKAAAGMIDVYRSVTLGR